MNWVPLEKNCTSLGSLLEIQRISFGQQMGDSGVAMLAHAMATNSTVTKLIWLAIEFVSQVLLHWLKQWKSIQR